ncbi:MAG: hypothetical protein FJ279_05530 [Planctomycetes bacterium]|nr:hypothetical protein [Planctomycetota bacterium]
MTTRRVASVLAIALAAGFLLCGYEFVRSVSSSLYIGAYGAHRLPIVMALAPVGTVLVIYAYGVLLTWLGPHGALVSTSGLSAAVILACYFSIVSGAAPATGVLYVFREAYIVVIIEQYWSFINSTLGHDDARKLNGPICGIASLGAIAGGLLVKHLAPQRGTEYLLILAAASLVPAAVFSAIAYRLGGEPKPSQEETRARHGHLALGLFRSRYLLCLGLLIIATQVVSTVLDLRFSALVENALPVKDQRTAYLGGFYATLNAVSSSLQFLLVPLVLHLCPLRLVHPCIPLVHLAASAVLLLHPSLRTGAAAYLLFKSLDYSVFRAAKEILYIPLSFDARYRAKSVIDAFGYRFSKGAASGVIALAGLVFGKLPGGTYPLVAMVSAVAWILLVLRLTGPREGGEV